MTQAEAAKALGMSAGRLSQLKAAGRVRFGPDGAIDLEATRAHLNATLTTKGRHRKGQAAPAQAASSESPGLTGFEAELQRGRLEELSERIVTSRMRNDEAAGALAPVAALEARFAAAVEEVRSAVYAVAHDEAQRLAEEGDARVVRAMLIERLDQAFAKVADALERSADEPDDELDDDEA